MFFIPIPSNNAKFSFTIDLDRTVYRFILTFNIRQLSWDLQFAEQDGTPIVSGMKVLPAIEFLSRHKDTRLPPGLLLAIDPQFGDKGARPARSSLFNSSIKLAYFTEADLVAFDATNTFLEFLDASV